MREARGPAWTDWLLETGPSWRMEATAAYLKGIGIEHIDVLLASSGQSSPSPVVHELSHRFPVQTILRLDVRRAAGRSLPAGLLSSDPDVTLELITVAGRANADWTAFRLTRSGRSILLTAGMTTDGERGLLTATTAAAVTADYWRAATLPPFTSRDPRLLRAIDPTHLIVDGGESELMLTAYATAGISVSDPVRERSVVVSFGAIGATVRTMCPTPPSGMTLAGLTDDSYYHGLSCARLRWLSERSLRWFSDARDAQLRGFRPCPLCGGR
jgi:beta-lactamase superfamily II metal-dependent hydrolase